MAAVRVETASSAATEQVRRALSGRRADVWGFLFQLLLLFTLVFALAVLVVLLSLRGVTYDGTGAVKPAGEPPEGSAPEVGPEQEKS